MASRLLVSALLLLGGWGVSAAGAQEAAPCPAPGAAMHTANRKPDLVVRASARAQEVRFGSEPTIDVRLTGCSVLDTVRVLERRNLPDTVQPHVSYRDVFVAVEILGHLDVECLLSGLGIAPRRLAPDSARAPGGALLPQLCRTEGADSIPRSPPRQ